MQTYNDKRSPEAEAYSHLKKTSRWQKLRLRILARDLYMCQRTGILLSGKHPAPNSPVVDHVRPHRGDETLFWDEHNLMAVSKAYHDGPKQSEERTGRKVVTIGADGWPVE